MEIKELHSIFLECGKVSTDTRKIEPGSLFFAIRGERFNANAFAAEALSKGAAHVVIDDATFFAGSKTILVDDSLKTLQQLAAYHRKHLGIPILALTGSNGKTTTKELIHAVLLQKFNALATIGNLNNHIGVPLTLLRFDRSTQFGIVEMGANHQKEIEFLCSIAQPDYGYITNFGKAHLEGFGGVEGVIKGKSELYDYLRANHKLAFVNSDDPMQLEKTACIKRYTFGAANNPDVEISNVTASPLVALNFNGNQLRSQLIGVYNAANIEAAVAIGTFFEVGTDMIVQAIESYRPENNRSQLISRNGREIILDAYNANPSSMAVAISNFEQIPGDGKAAILGDMFELGQDSALEHRAIVNRALAISSVDFYFVGEDFYANKTEAPNLRFFRDFDSFTREFTIDSRVRSVLIKGSRAMALERCLDLIG